MTRPKPIRRFLQMLLVGCVVAVCRAGLAQDRVASEYQLKAAWLYNLTRFVEWPETNFSSTNSPFVIGILGDDPFGAALDQAVKGEFAHGHPLIIERLKPGDDTARCQILFISRSESTNLEALLASIKSKAILTVADSEGAGAHGMMVNLLVARDTVKMEINNEAAKQSHLQISSRLLGLAKIVKTTAQP